MYYDLHNGVYFVEGIPRSSQVIMPISTEINEFFCQTHLKNLDHIKDKMAKEARLRGGNAIIQFTYGQRSTFWKSLFRLDNIQWYASGKIAVIDVDELD
jgi:hypothetical protein